MDGIARHCDIATWVHMALAAEQDSELRWELRWELRSELRCAWLHRSHDWHRWLRCHSRQRPLSMRTNAITCALDPSQKHRLPSPQPRACELVADTQSCQTLAAARSRLKLPSPCENRTPNENVLLFYFALFGLLLLLQGMGRPRNTPTHARYKPGFTIR